MPDKNKVAGKSSQEDQEMGIAPDMPDQPIPLTFSGSDCAFATAKFWCRFFVTGERLTF